MGFVAVSMAPVILGSFPETKEVVLAPETSCIQFLRPPQPIRPTLALWELPPLPPPKGVARREGRGLEVGV